MSLIEGTIVNIVIILVIVGTVVAGAMIWLETEHWIDRCDSFGGKLEMLSYSCSGQGCPTEVWCELPDGLRVDIRYYKSTVNNTVGESK